MGNERPSVRGLDELQSLVVVRDLCERRRGRSRGRLTDTPHGAQEVPLKRGEHRGIHDDVPPPDAEAMYEAAHASKTATERIQVIEKP
jgi:hypothetical protein